MRFKILKQGGYGSGGISDAGGNMSGPLVLAGNPTQPLEAATKGYVDTALGNLNGASLSSGLIPAERFPLFTGDLINVAGSKIFSLSETGVTPSTYPRVTVNAKGRVTNGFLLAENNLPGLDWNKVSAGKPTTMLGYGITDAVAPAGGTMTGPLVLNNAPTGPLHAVPKSYVDALVAGNAGGSYKTGDVVRKATATTPTGFLRANGGEVSRELYSALFEVMKDTYGIKTTMAYTSYAAVGGGQPWKNQFDFKTANVTHGTWSKGSNLAFSVQLAQAVVTKNRIYLLGGHNGTVAQDIVQSAPIVDGVIGTWVIEAGRLPTAKKGATAFVTKNRIYLVGGSDSNGSANMVFTATINIDGTLGAWVRDTNLPLGMDNALSVVTKNRVYVVSITGNTIVALINEDGTVGAWSSYTLGLPIRSEYTSMFVTRNRVYVYGANYGFYTALINSDGTLSAFSSTSITTEGSPSFVNPQFVVVKNRVWRLGGYYTAGGVVMQTADYANINADGTLTNFGVGGSSQVNLAHPTYNSHAVMTSTRMYLLGGITGDENGENMGVTEVTQSAIITGDFGLSDYSMFTNGTINKFDGSDVSGEIIVQNDYPAGPTVQPGVGNPWNQQYEINSTQSAELGAWSSTSNNITGCNYPAIVVTKNRVYLLSEEYGNNRVTAPINADGTLGVWTSLNGTMTIPVEHKQACPAVIKNRVYLFGADTTAVSMADIGADGTIGNFVSVNPLARACMNASVVATHSRVYLIGDTTGSPATLPIQSAAINTDGTLGTWSVMTHNHGKCNSAKAVVVKNRVYLIGGQRSDNTVNVTYTTIDSSGVLSATWVNGDPIPLSTFTTTYGSHSCVVYVSKNRVYLISPAIINTGVKKTYSAPINTDGTLGTWVENAIPMPVSVYGGASFVTSSRLYYIGGTIYNTSNDTWEPRTNRIFYTTITGGLNDYTSYYNGSIIPVLSSNFRLPDYSSKELPGSYSYIKT